MTDELEVVPLAPSPYLPLLPDDHRLCASPSISLSDLAEEHWPHRTPSVAGTCSPAAREPGSHPPSPAPPDSGQPPSNSSPRTPEWR